MVRSDRQIKISIRFLELWYGVDASILVSCQNETLSQR